MSTKNVNKCLLPEAVGCCLQTCSLIVIMGGTGIQTFIILSIFIS